VGMHCLRRAMTYLQHTTGPMESSCRVRRYRREGNLRRFMNVRGMFATPKGTLCDLPASAPCHVNTSLIKQQVNVIYTSAACTCLTECNSSSARVCTRAAGCGGAAAPAPGRAPRAAGPAQPAADVGGLVRLSRGQHGRGRRAGPLGHYPGRLLGAPAEEGPARPSAVRPCNLSHT